jgi:hypothetical protein
MDRKKLLVAGGLIGLVICLFSAFMIISLVSKIIDPFPEYNNDNAYSPFNNSTPESTAVSIARLNYGVYYGNFNVEDAYLTPDGKYWKVDMITRGLDPMCRSSSMLKR